MSSYEIQCQIMLRRQSEMLFSSYVFVLLFLPITLIIYFLFSHKVNIYVQHGFLILASLFFYGYFNPVYLLIIVISMVVNYGTGVIIENMGNKGVKKYFFIFGIIFNIGLIGYFKYYDFFIENINLLFATDFASKHMILPLGISFFTFQQLSFIISVFKEESKVENFIDYSLFVTFFPQLVAGPIVLYNEMIPQFRDNDKRFFHINNFSDGIVLFVFGLFKKSVIADTLAVYVDNGFHLSTYGMAASWIVSICYSLQIYFDFSGYSDMAIGIGKMFNFELPINFNQPYKSESISEFWRRWHITLGRALSTYIYRPLGGSRNGIYKTVINLFITFFISGLWHGAAWTFIIWGALHGILVAIERIINLKSNVVCNLPHIFKVVSTFLTINVLWVLFRAESFSKAIDIYKGLLSLTNIQLSQINSIVNDGIVGLPLSINVLHIFLLLFVIVLIVFWGISSLDIQKRFQVKRTGISALAVAAMFLISILCLSKESVFIYFNF